MNSYKEGDKIVLKDGAVVEIESIFGVFNEYFSVKGREGVFSGININIHKTKELQEGCKDV